MSKVKVRGSRFPAAPCGAVVQGLAGLRLASYSRGNRATVERRKTPHKAKAVASVKNMCVLLLTHDLRVGQVVVLKIGKFF